jgi:thiosulfate/3-mercaptopyruvate sulfurtransferase
MWHTEINSKSQLKAHITHIVLFLNKIEMASRVLYRTLIETSDLARLLQSSSPPYILDSRLASPTNIQSHYSIRIPGAKYFDIDEIRDKSSHLPHMLPKEHEFIEYMKKLRIKNDERLVVCYDPYGVFCSPRVWYTFKVFGRQNVAVMNGGLKKWIEEGNQVESGEYQIYADPDNESDKDYNYKHDASKLKSTQQVKMMSVLLGYNPPQTMTQIVDTRPAHVFAGSIATGYDAVSGNIPNSLNLPFKKLLTENGCMKPSEECKKLFNSAGLNLDNSRNTIHLCQTGITSCISILAMEMCGKSNNALYDGSWLEYVTFKQSKSLEEEKSQDQTGSNMHVNYMLQTAKEKYEKSQEEKLQNKLNQ